jgi:hypothetical protein
MQSTFRNVWRGFVALAIVLASASAVRAQTITDARRIEFTPSVDHNAVDANGVPLLQSYSLQLFVAGGARRCRLSISASLRPDWTA